ncbi:hypothetical protein HPC49_02015 [Pyxidicoccus fallax]|uniref:Lipoprotein n=1 Tax=Pyxidicoccus fallax TaxID=394095 RepID=A0A848LAA1_9BACT|nr:hypothetical protein [Pyxidicoccus fallax]NMO13785.1 hypothetical protein [Pyxidicoccus fallax]NPC77028.1 hypothetical protein [Pyxidicoccus fallax]
MTGAARTCLMFAAVLALVGPARGASREARTLLFERVGYNPLPNPGDTIARGRNGPTGISGDCLYVGSHVGHRAGTGPAFGTPLLPPEVLIVDISHRRRPRVVGALPTVLNASPRELHTLPAARTLLVMNQREPGPDAVAVNTYQLHDITDCRHPVLRQTISLGVDPPRALFPWRDPHEPARFLLYAALAPDDAREPALRVFELMAPPDGPVSPEPVATFAFARARPGTPLEWHDEQPAAGPREDARSVSVSPDGTRVYVATRDGGTVVLDSSPLANREPCLRDGGPPDGTSDMGVPPCLRRLSPDARAGLTPPSTGTEPVVSPALDRPAGLVFTTLAFVAGPSAGLRVRDLANPVRPRELGGYVPQPASRVVERSGDSADAERSTLPILYDGLLYLTDEDSGLHVLRYRGPRARELPRRGLFAGNTHLLTPPPPPPRSARAAALPRPRPWNHGRLEE